MATTTVRLDPDDEQVLDHLAAVHGGRSNALREGLALLAAQTRRQATLAAVLADWERDTGPVDDAEVTSMVERYEL